MTPYESEIRTLSAQEVRRRFAINSSQSHPSSNIAALPLNQVLYPDSQAPRPLRDVVELSLGAWIDPDGDKKINDWLRGFTSDVFLSKSTSVTVRPPLLFFLHRFELMTQDFHVDFSDCANMSYLHQGEKYWLFMSKAYAAKCRACKS